MPDTKSFLFDIGNVICTFDFSLVLTRLQAQSIQVSADPPHSIDSIKVSYETGLLSEDEFIAAISRITGFTGNRKEFTRIWCDIFTENKQMTNLIMKLQAQGHNLYLLSNTNHLHLEHLKRNFSAFTHFSGGIFSHMVGVMKPQSEIYQMALDHFSLKAEETILSLSSELTDAFLCGGIPLGITITLSSGINSNKFFMISVWPLCTGSKVPPKIPINSGFELLKILKDENYPLL